jgi:hypothetical protein
VLRPHLDPFGFRPFWSESDLDPDVWDRIQIKQTKFAKKMVKNLFRPGSGFGRFQKSDLYPDTVKNRPDSQHWQAVVFVFCSPRAKVYLICKDFNGVSPTRFSLIFLKKKMKNLHINKYFHN